MSGGCVKTPPLFADVGMISIFDAEVVHDAIYRGLRPSADDVAA